MTTIRPLAVLVPLMLSSFAGAQVIARPLSFADRVDAQARLERVAYAHRSGTVAPFEEVVTGEVLERKVRAYLAEAVALETYWGVTITPAMLSAELQRMARGTRQPERLLELFAALGNDPVLVQECLAKPALVERLVRNRFAYDRKLHAAARESAEAVRDTLRAGKAPLQKGEDLDVIVGTARDERPGVLAVDRATFDAMRASQIRLAESAEDYVVDVLRDDLVDRLHIQRYTVPKLRWETWWDGVRDTLPVRVEASATTNAALPAVNTTTPCDVWDNGSLDDAPAARSEHSAVWTGTEMLVWGGSWFAIDGDRYDPVTDTWSKMSMINAPEPRYRHTAVWTGRWLIIWGGNHGHALDTGARYEPATDTWTPLPSLGAPVARERHTAVWTGSEMIVWGGLDDAWVNRGDGSRYDPAANRWTPMRSIDAPLQRREHTATWTGTWMMIWGGFAPGGQTDTGALYDPQSDTWTPITTAGAPARRAGHSAAWTGREVVIWGGWNSIDGDLNDGARYEPATGTWTPVASEGAPVPREGFSATWTGSELLVWGGRDRGFHQLASGSRYEPRSNTWRPISTEGEPRGRETHTAVWTGSALLVWGGFGDGARDDGDRYDPVLDRWTAFGPPAVPAARASHRAVWTGSEMLVWGGVGLDHHSVSSGELYDPATDTWRAMSEAGAPGPINRANTATWTGRELIVWGISETSTPGTRGGRYEVATDTWRPVSLDGAPSTRVGHSAVWTGSRMLIWGGFMDDASWNRTYFGDGAAYDPVDDTWTPINPEGSPSPRADHVAEWTGTEMIVWAGESPDYPYTYTGGRYVPASDSWLPMSVDGAPTVHEYYSSAWSGTELLVCEHYGADWSVTCGRYNPAVDRWLPMSSPGPKTGFSAPLMVWTGLELLAWFDAAGGRYSPEIDAWTPMSDTSRPSERWDFNGVWTGDALIVWGGYSDLAVLRSGGLYRACSKRPPVAVIDAAAVSECSSPDGTPVTLDGSRSYDLDSTPGTNDDIAQYAWFEGETLLATGPLVEHAFAVGAHAIELVVTDRTGLTGTAQATIEVRHTAGPGGAITIPSEGACFGPRAVPVRVEDSFADACSASTGRAYEPPGGVYAAHGDYRVVVTANDEDGNTTVDDVRFTIDLVPPAAGLLAGAERWLSMMLPFNRLFTSGDDDAAAGGVVHEVLALDGCAIFDGTAFGDRDGLLSDEVAPGRDELCRIATLCGRREWVNPTLALTATDCGGNATTITRRLVTTLRVPASLCSRSAHPAARRHR